MVATLYIYRGHSAEVFTVAWTNSDGRRVGSGGYDNTVRSWRPQSRLRALGKHMYLRSPVVVRDG